ncbi:mitochondrial glyco protein [Coniophora puteana RWD-64-598 SS2]|uniref:Mitochondrial glyco protein n=1 Tax=Coniophora puteana (strain RWD-64-598) TaxID=741705 RepID=A0A5M3MXF6_CONPW|nr:mitochondrial glyco protein [Coniophora puteana RWD-64-598 SS2]EIW83766.1 mitochondrial glyco protein [Coniophora puteana RWD-64-598 SS2]
MPAITLCETCGQRPRFVEASGKVHPYCGKACADVAAAVAASTSAKPPKTQKPSPGSHFRHTSSPPTNGQSAPRAAKLPPPSPDLNQALADELASAKALHGQGVGLDIVAEFKRRGTWRIEDCKGMREVWLARRAADEWVNIAFSYVLPDAAGGSGASVKGKEKDVRYQVILSKPKKGAIIVSGNTTTSGKFAIGTIAHCSDGAKAAERTPEGERYRASVWEGSRVCSHITLVLSLLFIHEEIEQFDDLPSHVRTGFVRYLQKRGIDDELAMFVREYVKQKEQIEYVNWLESVQTFVA